MNLKRKQIYNCCRYIHYLNIVDENFTADNHKWLNEFKTSEVFNSDNIEISKAEKEMLKSIVEQIKTNHAEEIKIYNEQIHKKAEQAIKKLNYVFNLFGNGNYFEGVKELIE